MWAALASSLALFGDNLKREAEAAMDVKEAVRAARTYVIDLFDAEDITDVGLEEVAFDDDSSTWRITMGFARPWDKGKPLHILAREGLPARAYKVLRINDRSGVVESVTDRLIKMSD